MSKWIGRALLALRLGTVLACQMLAVTAWAFDYDYSAVRFDLTHDAIFGTAEDFAEWREGPYAYMKEKFQGLPFNAPYVDAVEFEDRRDRYVLMSVRLIFPAWEPDGSPFSYSVLIAQPPASNGRPAILAINGHGEVGGEGRGQAPVGLFKPGAHGDILASRGYVVIGFPNTMHAQFAKLAQTLDYSFIWARLAGLALDAIKGRVAPTRFFAVGNAAGGLTSLVLTIAREDVIGLATNGAFFSLDHTRREYRIWTHPFCHDFRAFFSYASVYALVAPKPLQVQMGKQDGLWLGSGPVAANSWFSGMKRGAFADETLGSFLMLRSIYDRTGGRIELLQHDRGHEDFEGEALMSFLDKWFASSDANLTSESKRP
jgi:hypothetical protein